MRIQLTCIDAGSQLRGAAPVGSDCSTYGTRANNEGRDINYHARVHACRCMRVVTDAHQLRPCLHAAAGTCPYHTDLTLPHQCSMPPSIHVACTLPSKHASTVFMWMVGCSMHIQVVMRHMDYMQYAKQIEQRDWGMQLTTGAWCC